MNKPSFLVSICPIAFLIGVLSLNVIYFGEDSSYGANQIAMFTTALLTAAIGHFLLGVPYNKLEAMAIDSISRGVQAILILLTVGALVGVWIFNGIVPAMIYHGVNLLNPNYFLLATVVICSVVSVASGSSWTTVGTVGIAFIGIGKALGIDETHIAGAIISGAYFGDKMSPLSDTTNLAPAMAGADLFTHIRHLLYTTVPAFAITLVVFLWLGLSMDVAPSDSSQIADVKQVIQDNFNLSPWLFTLPLLVFYLVKKKRPAFPALATGTFVGVLFIFLFQWDLLAKMSANTSFYKTIIDTTVKGFSIETDNEMINTLFTRGGMNSMLNTVWLILSALLFGGMLEATKMIETIAEKILSLVSTVGSLVTATVSSAIFLNVTSSDQYISIILSGKMFKDAYQQRKLAPENLSRAVEDGGTVTSVLIPWNTCGAYFSGVLGIATLSYLPFAVFNYTTPLISILIAYLGYGMKPLATTKEN